MCRSKEFFPEQSLKYGTNGTIKPYVCVTTNLE